MTTASDMKAWRKQQRSRLLAERAALSEAQRQQLQTRVLDKLSVLLQDYPPTLLGIYWPIKGELDVRPLAETLIAAGWQIALPIINDISGKLDFSLWHPAMEMEQGSWNIPVPVQQSLVQPAMFLIPLVGFDQHNYRLGYGGGYYDRTLAPISKAVTTIGVGLEMGRFETIHPHALDIPLDIIVTETVSQQR